MNSATAREKSIISPAIYYDLLDRPLTIMEIYKYQAGGNEQNSPPASLSQIIKTLRDSSFLKNRLTEKNGLYFLQNRQKLLAIRAHRLKISQLKWKKIKKAGQWLTLIPFVRMAAVTGSLTAYNANPASDLDILLVVQPRRLWLARLWTIIIIDLLGQRRHGQIIQDRFCLNCYLTENHLEIQPEAKPRDWHSAHEYRRLTPITEQRFGLYQNFIDNNKWLTDYFSVCPRINQQTSHRAASRHFFNLGRRLLEQLLSGRMGDWLEKKSGDWQKQRIAGKTSRQANPDDQIYVSDDCLILHPRSKSRRLNNAFNLKTQALCRLST